MKNKSSLLSLILFALVLLQAIVVFLVFSPVKEGAQPVRTAIPPIRNATLPPVSQVLERNTIQTGECEVAALDLLGAWVEAQAPENEAFAFTSTDGKKCQATYSNSIEILLNEPNVWYGGAIACTSCHGEDVTRAAANLSLTDYPAIIAGSRRADNQSEGQDILGKKTTWNQSKLYVQIFTRQMPVGRPFDSPQAGPMIRVGTVK